MVKITIGTNTRRETVIVEETRTLKSVLEENNIPYGTATVCLDGAPLQPGELNKTFTDFGVTESAYLLAVVKADNA